MPRTSIRLSLLFVLFAGACDSVEAPIRVELGRQPIIGGVVDPGHPAVGAVVVSAGFLCTGTLVSSKVVVTGAHCIHQGLVPDKFALGPATDRATEIHDIVQCIQHSGYGIGIVENTQVNLNDIMVCVLAAPAQAAPMKIRTAPIEGLAGTQVAFVGFGVTTPGNAATTGTKMVVSAPIGLVATEGFFNFTTPANPKNTCTGDSGGPSILNNGGVDEIIGVTSQGDAGCVESGWNIRVDTHTAWIQQMIQTHDSGGGAYCGDGECGSGESKTSCPADCTAESCGEISYQGCCDGELLEYCQDGILEMIHCGSNPACGWNAEGSYYDCATDGGADPSGTHPIACGGGAQAPVCGDGTCAPGETGCPADCGEDPPPEPVCGDGLCQEGEVCPADCGEDPPPGPVCGDGVCHAGEACPPDCDLPDGLCGNGACDPGEECGVCIQDCGFCIEGEDGGGGGGCGTRDPAAGIWALLLVAAFSLRTRRSARPG